MAENPLASASAGDFINDVLVEEFGHIVRLSGGTGDEPTTLADDMERAAEYQLRSWFARYAEREGVTWTTEPEGVAAPLRWGAREDGWFRIPLFDQYDDEGNGIGEPDAHGWFFEYGMRALGYRRPA